MATTSTFSPVGMAAMKILTPEKQKEIISNVFGRALEVAPEVEKTPVEAATDRAKTSYLDILEQKKKSLEEQKTSNAKLARYNALGNVLTSMVQPLGWAIGGGGTGVTGGVQKYDDRQYLEAFNRAVKASDELKNLGSAEAEYQFKIDEEARQRAIEEEQYQRRRKENLEDWNLKNDAEIEKQKAIYDMRSQLNQEQIQGRIQVAEATAKAKYKFNTKGGGRVAESVRDNLLKRANAKYAEVLSDYYKKKQIGLEGLQEPPTYDEFLKNFVSENGYSMSDGSSTSSTKSTGTKKETKTDTKAGAATKTIGW